MKTKLSILISALFFLPSVLLYSQNISSSAVIKEVWIDNDIIFNNAEGIEVHIVVEVHNHINREGQVAFLFFLEDISPLKDYNGEYVSINGQVFTSTKFRADSAADTKTVVVFIPYKEMHVQGANVNLKCLAIVYDYQGRQIAMSDYIDFTVEENYSSDDIDEEEYFSEDDYDEQDFLDEDSDIE